MLIAHENLRKFATIVFERGGSEPAEARLVADHLVDANMVGHDSHGVGMIPTYVRHLHAGLVSPNTSADLARDDGAILVFDGNRGYGRPAAGVAMAAAIDRCRDTGVVVAGLRRAHHIGRVGAFGEQVIAAGFVSVHFVNVTDHSPSVAPFGGADGRYVTNPVCVAVPGTETTPPIVLDMATTLMAQGKIRVARNKGERLPEGVVIDGQGRPSTDPEVMFQSPQGAMMPFATYKGYGLALVCELLAGVLSGGGTCRPQTNRNHDTILNNMLSIIIDPTRLVGQDFFDSEAAATLSHVKASPPLNPDEPVLVPGDPERATGKQRRADGIPVDEQSWRLVADAALTAGIAEDRIEAIARV